MARSNPNPKTQPTKPMPAAAKGSSTSTGVRNPTK